MIDKSKSHYSRVKEVKAFVPCDNVANEHVNELLKEHVSILIL